MLIVTFATAHNYSISCVKTKLAGFVYESFRIDRNQVF